MKLSLLSVTAIGAVFVSHAAMADPDPIPVTAPDFRGELTDDDPTFQRPFSDDLDFPNDLDFLCECDEDEYDEDEDEFVEVRPDVDLDNFAYDTYQITIYDSLNFFIATLVRDEEDSDEDSFAGLGTLDDSYIFLYPRRNPKVDADVDAPGFDPENPEDFLVAYSDDYSVAIGEPFDSAGGLSSGLEPTSELSEIDADPIENGEYLLVVTSYDPGEYGTYYGYLNGVLLGWDLELLQLTDPMSDLAQMMASANGASLLFLNSAHGVSGQQGQSSLATRNQHLSFSRATGNPAEGLVATASSQNRPGFMGNLYTWIEVTGFRADDDSLNRDYSGRGLQIGADLAVSGDMVVGLSVGVQDIDVSGGAYTHDGTLRFMQPYLAYTAGAWSGEASLMLGWGEFSQNVSGITGTGDTELRALSFTGRYDVALSDTMTITPTLGLTRGEEETTGTGGSLAGTGSVSVQFTEVSLGARLTRVTGSGAFFAGLHADWLDTSSDTQLVADVLSDDGWTGRIEFGGSVAMNNGFELDTSISVAGLGGDMRSTTASLNVGIRF